MKYKLIYSFLCLVSVIRAHPEPALKQSFDKAAFYAVMASGDMEKIDGELAVIEASSFPGKEAFEGALLMRKSGILKKAQEKLKAFKAGRIKLETALLDDADNAEYRFLRLTIQEHAPKVVKYDKQLESDSQFIQKAYKKLSPVVQHAILEYSKTSKALRPEDL